MPRPPRALVLVPVLVLVRTVVRAPLVVALAAVALLPLPLPLPLLAPVPFDEILWLPTYCVSHTCSRLTTLRRTFVRLRCLRPSSSCGPVATSLCATRVWNGRIDMKSIPTLSYDSTTDRSHQLSVTHEHVSYLADHDCEDDRMVWAVYPSWVVCFLVSLFPFRLVTPPPSIYSSRNSLLTEEHVLASLGVKISLYGSKTQAQSPRMYLGGDVSRLEDDSLPYRMTL